MSLNKALIIGRLGRDPEIRYTQAGTSVATMSIATSEKWTDKNTGQKQERTEWHRVTVFGRQAENCSQYLQKGSQVYVEGRIETSQYEKDGQTHYSTAIIANAVQFLDSPGQKQQQPQGAQGGQSGSGYSQAPQYPQGGQQYRQQPPQQGGYQGGYQQAPAGNQSPPQQGYQQAPQGPPAQQWNQGQQSPGGPPPAAPPYHDDDIPF